MQIAGAATPWRMQHFALCVLQWHHRQSPVHEVQLVVASDVAVAVAVAALGVGAGAAFGGVWVPYRQQCLRQFQSVGMFGRPATKRIYVVMNVGCRISRAAYLRLMPHRHFFHRVFFIGFHDRTPTVFCCLIKVKHFLL